MLANGRPGGVSPHLEGEGLIEDGVESFLVDLCVKLLLLIRENKDLHVRVRGAAAVHGEEISGLEDSHGQLWRRNVRFKNEKMQGYTVESEKSLGICATNQNISSLSQGCKKNVVFFSVNCGLDFSSVFDNWPGQKKKFFQTFLDRTTVQSVRV